MTGPRFFAEALAETEDAAVHYATREEGLGARLVREFEEAIALAMGFLTAPPLVHEAPAAYRLPWVLLGSCPIQLVYTVSDDALLVQARRRPGYWLDRLKQLGRP